ncbi:UNVERIFIED_CONTAM: hypothetical protein GTU68_042867 [Idotea baltica]|nr:hypothetical protein [Idotea baltica]
MLILSRKLGESIVIGEDINITVLGVTGNQIRIGIDAPKSVAVHREEVYQRITKELGSDVQERRQGSNHLRSRSKARTPNLAIRHI